MHVGANFLVSHVSYSMSKTVDLLCCCTFFACCFVPVLILLCCDACLFSLFAVFPIFVSVCLYLMLKTEVSFPCFVCVSAGQAS